MLAYAGKAPFFTGSVDLSTLAAEVCGLLKAAVPKHVTVRTALAADLPSIQGDPSQIQQLLMSLGLNAAEAIGEKSGSVLISTALERIGHVHIQRDMSG